MLKQRTLVTVCRILEGTICLEPVKSRVPTIHIYANSHGLPGSLLDTAPISLSSVLVNKSLCMSNLEISRFDMQNIEISRFDMQNIEISRLDMTFEYKYVWPTFPLNVGWLD